MANKKNITSLLILFGLSFVVTLVYFTSSETATIYGDDLGFYMTAHGRNGLGALFAHLYGDGKFRPVSGILNNINLLVFDKNLHNYFLFNVFVQSLTICTFSRTINLFVKNTFLSWLLALLLGLSRFAHYNISQIYNGGSMEGLGVFLFTLALYFIFKYMLDENATPQRSIRYLAWAMVFANLDVYVHERYIVVLPFIALLVLFYPLRNRLAIKQKLTIASIAIAGVGLNFLLKLYVSHSQFFVGTGGDGSMTFDIDRMLGFFQDAVLSIVQYNSGEQGWSGTNFAAQNIFHQIIAFITIEFILLILVLFFITAPKPDKTDQKETEGAKSRYIVISLFVLMLFCLIPAVSTIRVEQRWLQAPLATLLLILFYAFYNIRTKFKVAKYAVFGVFVLYFFVSDYYYYVGYRKSSYWGGAEGTATNYKEACFNGTIRKQTKTLYILVGNRVHFPSGALLWDLVDGLFFDYYQGSKKKIIILDFDMYKDKTQLPYIVALNKETEQVIEWNGIWLVDVTDKVLNERDSHLKEQLEQ
jgi:hypothetical protein